MEINEGKNSKFPLLKSNVSNINKNESLSEKDNKEEMKNISSYNDPSDKNKIFNNVLNGSYYIPNHSFDNFKEDKMNEEDSKDNKILDNKEKNIDSNKNKKDFFENENNLMMFDVDDNNFDSFKSSIIYGEDDEQNQLDFSFIYNSEIELFSLDDTIKKIGGLFENKNDEINLMKVDFNESLIIENKNKSLVKKDLKEAFDVLTNLLDKEDKITSPKDAKIEIELEGKSNKSKEVNNLNKEKQKVPGDNINLKEKNDICSNNEKIENKLNNISNNNTNNTNNTNYSSTKSSTLNNISMNASLLYYKKKKKFKIDYIDNMISNAVDLNKTSNNILFWRKRKRLKEKTKIKINKTEDISKPVFREFRTYLKKKKNKYKNYFTNNKEFWDKFLLGKKTPPFCFKYKEKELKFKSFNREFFEFIMSVEDMYTLYEKFLNDTVYQIEQKKERKAKNIQAYEHYLNNFHKIYSKEMDENCLIFEFKENK